MMLCNLKKMTLAPDFAQRPLLAEILNNQLQSL